MGGVRLIDLSHNIRDHWRYRVRLEKTKAHDAGDLFEASVLHMGVHGFTHVDAPLHLLAGGDDIASLPLEVFAGEAAVVDLSHLGENGRIDATELAAHGQHLRRGDIALVRTDWDKKCEWNAERFWAEAPYFTRDGSEWLLERGVKAVGSDFPPDWIIREVALKGVSPCPVEEYVTHDVLLRNGVYLIEYLANLSAIPGPRTFFLALPLKIDGSDGSPVRAIAMQFEAGEVLRVVEGMVHDRRHPPHCYPTSRFM